MKRLTSIGLSALFLATGLACGGLFIALKPSPEVVEPSPSAIPVEVHRVSLLDRAPVVESQGVVEAAETTPLTPLVSGQVVWVSPALETGSRVGAGEALVRLDTRDFEYRVAQQQASVRAAELELSLEEGRGSVASEAWSSLAQSGASSAVALREPHLASAKASLESARASLASAQLDLERATLRAPYDALVTSRALGTGQLAAQGAQLATLVDARRAYVRVSLRVEQLGLVDVPGFNADRGSTVRLTQDLGTAGLSSHEGQVTHLAGELDADTRTAQLLIEVEHPLEPPEGSLPLLPGSFVEADIDGRLQDGVFAVPRDALHEGDRVWLVEEGSVLGERSLEISWWGRDQVFVTGGLGEGDLVVTSPMALPLPGQPVEISDLGGES